MNMKKNVLTIIAIIFMSYASIASNSDLFKIDFNAVNQEFTELNIVEDMVVANPDLTYSSLSISDAGLIESLSLVPNSAVPLANGNAVLGIPSFWWGCGLGLVGVGVVYFLTDKDSSEAKKALWGCLVGSLVWGGGYFFTGIF